MDFLIDILLNGDNLLNFFTQIPYSDLFNNIFQTDFFPPHLVGNQQYLDIVYDQSLAVELYQSIMLFIQYMKLIFWRINA